jgi:hypothetical protein
MNKAFMIAGLLLGLAGMASTASAEEDAAANARARLEAAQKVYKCLLARWRTDPNFSEPFEQLHRWSLRWREAQAEPGTKKDRLAAAEAHLMRMRDLDKVARKLLEKRLLAPYEVSQTEFYRLDAEKHLHAVKKN